MKNEKPPLVLVVDDTPLNLQYISQICEDSGYDVSVAIDSTKVIDYVQSEKPDLILLDIIMPEIDGLELCRQIKQIADISGIPIIFITAKTDPNDIVKGFEAGGVDYVIKPFNSLELKSRIKTHIDLKLSRDELYSKNSELIQKNLEITRMYKKIKGMMEEMEIMSITDSLTGLYNRRYILDRINKEIARYKRSKQTFSVVLGDIDHFKTINDTYGHNAGDAVLKSISMVLSDSVREVDMVARWGGEEFLVLLPETEKDGAEILSERLRMTIECNQIIYENASIAPTISLGIASYNGTDTLDEIIKKADIAMYESKKSGRNRTCIFDD